MIQNLFQKMMICITQNTGEDLKSLIEQASQQISAENTEHACAFIQKTAIEKAVPEMEKKLTEVQFSDILMSHS